MSREYHVIADTNVFLDFEDTFIYNTLLMLRRPSFFYIVETVMKEIEGIKNDETRAHKAVEAANTINSLLNKTPTDRGVHVVCYQTPPNAGGMRGDSAILATAQAIAYERRQPVFLITSDKEFLSKIQIPVIGMSPMQWNDFASRQIKLLTLAKTDTFFSVLAATIEDMESILWPTIFDMIHTNPDDARMFAHRMLNNVNFIVSESMNMAERQKRTEDNMKRMESERDELLSRINALQSENESLKSRLSTHIGAEGCLRKMTCATGTYVFAIIGFFLTLCVCWMILATLASMGGGGTP